MLREMRELFSYHSKATRRFAVHDVRNVFEKTLRDLRPFGFDGFEGKRVLDLGCGQRMAFALQSAASGAAAVVALDVDYVARGFLPLDTYRIVRANGWKRAAKSIVRRLLFDGPYYRSLEATAGRPLRSYLPAIQVQIADPTAGRYPLPDASFDLVASNSVLEHVKDVDGVAREAARVLARGGFFYAIIHNFYSLSGGHHMEWAFPDEHPSSRIPPWDHLREGRFPPFAYLNRWMPDGYRQAFSTHLDVLLFEGRDIQHDPGGLEGEKYLTPEIEKELARYPRDLLLTRAWCLICRKP